MAAKKKNFFSKLGDALDSTRYDDAFEEEATVEEEEHRPSRRREAATEPADKQSDKDQMRFVEYAFTGASKDISSAVQTSKVPDSLTNLVLYLVKRDADFKKALQAATAPEKKRNILQRYYVSKPEVSYFTAQKAMVSEDCDPEDVKLGYFYALGDDKFEIIKDKEVIRNYLAHQSKD